MPLKPCITCGVLGQGSYCAQHQPDRGRQRKAPGRSSSAQERFRLAVLARAGYRCQAIEHGVRCQAKSDLEAHH